MPFRGSKKHQTYDVVKFSSDKKKSFRLKENIDPNSKEPSFVRKRPERVGTSYIHKEYPGYVVKNKDDKKLLNKVKKNKIKIWHKKRSSNSSMLQTKYSTSNKIINKTKQKINR